MEDHPPIAALIGRVARKTGREVPVSASASALLALESTEEIELVIADINLPEITGLELAQKLRAKGVTCPLLLISGDSSIETLDISLRIAGASFLSKPFTMARPRNCRARHSKIP